MGPRPGGRGNPQCFGLAGRLGSLQWGHDRGAVETCCSSRKSMWSPFLQWGHDRGAVEPPPNPADRRRVAAFNGATTGGPWKQEEAGRLVRLDEPFNGATTGGPWKPLAFQLAKPSWVAAGIAERGAEGLAAGRLPLGSADVITFGAISSFRRAGRGSRPSLGRSTANLPKSRRLGAGGGNAYGARPGSRGYPNGFPIVAPPSYHNGVGRFHNIRLAQAFNKVAAEAVGGAEVEDQHLVAAVVDHLGQGRLHPHLVRRPTACSGRPSIAGAGRSRSSS